MSVGAEKSAQLTVDKCTPWGQHALLYVVFFLMGEMFLVSPLLPQIARSLGVWVALTSLGLWFMFGGVFHSSQQTFLSSAGPSQRATVIAWNNSMINAGMAVGTTVLGFVAAGSASFATITGALSLAAAAAAALPLITNSRARASGQTIPRSLS